MSLAAVVLAAGGSQRLGRPKQLLRGRDGHSLVRIAASLALESGADEVAVVLGACGAAVAESLSGLHVALIPSHDWHEGIAASIRTGTAWAAGRGGSALLVLVCDQPRLTSAHLRALVTASDAGVRPAASGYAGKLGVPALFPASTYGALLRLRGDAGASTVLLALPDVARVPWPDGELDVDTLADVTRFELEGP